MEPNVYIDKGDYFELIITSRRHGVKIVLIDKEDIDLIKPFQWSVVRQRKESRFYCQRYGGYVGSAPVLMHPSIMPYKNGFEVDHIDRDGLNNRRSNLRYATPTQNASNKKIRCDNKTGYKGVFKIEKTGRYMSYITSMKKRIYLGFYSTAEEAAEAYNKKAIELHGEFAHINKLKINDN